jgi:hypothetical protein
MNQGSSLVVRVGVALRSLAMACRGYFLALDEPCIALVLAQDGNDDRLIEVIKELDMTDAPDECGVDKAWTASTAA